MTRQTVTFVNADGTTTSTYLELEERARRAWQSWGHSYAQFTTCKGCGEMRHCRAPRRGSWLCLECFDQR